MRKKRLISKTNQLSLTLGILASGVLSGVGGLEVLAEEASGEDLGVENAVEKEDRVNERLQEVQKNKENNLGVLKEEGVGFSLEEDFTEKVENVLAKDIEVKDEEDELIQEYKEELNKVADLVQTKYQKLSNLVGVVNDVKSDRASVRRSEAGDITINEGFSKVDSIVEDIEVLIGIYGVVEEEVGEAKDIQEEVSKAEEELLARIQELLNRGSVVASSEEVSYNNGTVSSQSDVRGIQVSSSSIVQTTSSSKVLTSYHGQNDDLDNLISEGMQYVGGRYVWGGTSLSDGGFDCSGLMVRIFDDALGIKLPRVSSAQQNYGTRVSLNNIKPGDLVFWNTPATHVGLYLGDGKVLEAANRNAGIRVRSVQLSELSSATRVTEFGVEEKDAVVEITNAEKTVNSNPVLNEEESKEYNKNAEKEAKKLEEEKAKKEKEEAEKKEKEKAEQEKAEQEEIEESKESEGNKEETEQEYLEEEDEDSESKGQDDNKKEEVLDKEEGVSEENETELEEESGVEDSGDEQKEELDNKELEKGE